MQARIGKRGEDACHLSRESSLGAGVDNNSDEVKKQLTFRSILLDEVVHLAVRIQETHAL